MASLIAKKKANKLYYYVVESARVDGRPRIVHQTYLGTAEKVAALVKDRTAPVPLEATALDVGMPGALWLAAQQTGVFELLQSLWPQPRSGPSPAHHLLLAAIHRICQPGPKTEVAGWYDRTILRSLWDFPPDRFSSHEFWDCFDRIQEEQLEQAQIRLLGVWKQKQLVGRRLLAYDTTNFYTYVASTNTRNELAQRGHNKQGRHNLRQVGLSYVMDGGNGLSLCHHVYPGNRADAEELPEALSRIGALLDRNQIARDSVTLVLDKGSAALANTLELEKAGVGWISALPWNQAPAELRDRSVEQLPACGSSQPGVRAAAEKLFVHGKEYLCVLKYSACFASEQLNSTTAALTRVTQKLRRLATELSRPQARFTEQGIRNKIHRWLLDPFVRDRSTTDWSSERTAGI
jgi:Transposase DDE domain